MEYVWLAIAVIAGLVWLGISISQKREGDKHQREARDLADSGDWEGAAKSYKLAIISRLDSASKLEELINELAELYKANGHEVDLSQLKECPAVIKKLSAGTGKQKKKEELMMKLYTETGAFLDSLPGPSIDS